MVPNDFPYPKTRGLKKNQVSSMLGSQVIYEVVLGLLQPVNDVLDLQVYLRVLKMVPNNFPYPSDLFWLGLSWSDLF